MSTRQNMTVDQSLHKVIPSHVKEWDEKKIKNKHGVPTAETGGVWTKEHKRSFHPQPGGDKL